MTLEEAISREEALAYSFGERYKRLGEPVGDLMELEQEHRQMAEWLKELKKLRTEQKDVYMNGYNEGYEDGYCEALEDSH